MTKEQIKANDLTQMKGSSNWLTTLPGIGKFCPEQKGVCRCIESSISLATKTNAVNLSTWKNIM